jgi:hypothetical protein
MHDWYTSSALVKAPTSSLIGTYFVVDLTYMYDDSFFYWCMVDVLAWYKW